MFEVIFQNVELFRKVNSGPYSERRVWLLVTWWKLQHIGSNKNSKSRSRIYYRPPQLGQKTTFAVMFSNIFIEGVPTTAMT